MELLEKLSAAVRALRADEDRPMMAMSGGMVAEEGSVLAVDDLEAMARSVARRSFRDGVREGHDAARQSNEFLRRRVAQEAETRGVLAGLDVAIGMLSDSIESNEHPHGGASRAEMFDDLTQARDRVAREGMHGERADLCKAAEVQA